MLKVSVCIVTYNHEKFVAKMLDSVLMQETTFPFEIIIGDDLSRDNTRAILQDYQARYPDKIRLLLHDKNLGLNGKYNALATFDAAKGEYIAQMDGDDYLTDKHKLQKQVEFMDANPQYPATFHNAQVIYEDGSMDPFLFCNINKPDFEVSDLIGEDELCFIATSSLMFRNEDFRKHPEPAWTFKSTSGDIPRNILFAKRGPLGYLNEPMSVYRKNRGGASFVDSDRKADFLFNRIEMYSDINKELDYKYDKQLRKNIGRYYYMLLNSYEYGNTYWPRARFALKYLALAQPGPERIKEVVRDYLLPPFLQRIYSFLAISLYKFRTKA